MKIELTDKDLETVTQSVTNEISKRILNNAVMGELRKLMEQNVKSYIEQFLDETPNTEGQWEINSIMGEKIQEYLESSGIIEKTITNKINSKSFLTAQIEGMEAKLYQLKIRREEEYRNEPED